MSDHVAVMSQGVIEQVADGNTIYNKPESAFVASFVGENNLFSGKVKEVSGDYAIVDTPSGDLRARNAQRDGQAQLSTGDSAYVFVRPESLKFVDDRKFDNHISAQVDQQEFEGNFWQVFFNIKGSDKRIKLSMVNDGRSVGHDLGEYVPLGFNADLAVALPEGELAAE